MPGINRRDFIKLLAAGAAATFAPEIFSLPISEAQENEPCLNFLNQIGPHGSIIGETRNGISNQPGFVEIDYAGPETFRNAIGTIFERLPANSQIRRAYDRLNSIVESNGHPNPKLYYFSNSENKDSAPDLSCTIVYPDVVENTTDHALQINKWYLNDSRSLYSFVWARQDESPESVGVGPYEDCSVSPGKHYEIGLNFVTDTEGDIEDFFVVIPELYDINEVQALDPDDTSSLVKLETVAAELAKEHRSQLFYTPNNNRTPGVGCGPLDFMQHMQDQQGIVAGEIVTLPEPGAEARFIPQVISYNHKTGNSAFGFNLHQWKAQDYFKKGIYEVISSNSGIESSPIGIDSQNRLLYVNY